MIFQAAMARAILRGEKTQTRRPIKGDHPSTVKAGTTRAVQTGRGKPALFRIRIVHVEQQILGAITYQDARAEGFRTRDEFKAAWVRIHDKPAEDAEDTVLLERFDARHAHRPVWVLTFELDATEQPRFLAARPAPDYVTNPALALSGEGEALSESDFRRHVAERAGMTAGQWCALEQAGRDRDRQLVAMERRMAVARTHAAQTGAIRDRKVRSEMRIMEKMLAESRPEAVERRLRSVEGLIDRRAA